LQTHDVCAKHLGAFFAKLISPETGLDLDHLRAYTIYKKYIYSPYIGNVAENSVGIHFQNHVIKLLNLNYSKYISYLQYSVGHILYTNIHARVQ
jgi:hypothetical protein